MADLRKPIETYSITHAANAMRLLFLAWTAMATPEAFLGNLNRDDAGRPCIDAETSVIMASVLLGYRHGNVAPKSW
jgi:hypothetical protein